MGIVNLVSRFPRETNSVKTSQSGVAETIEKYLVHETPMRADTAEYVSWRLAALIAEGTPLSQIALYLEEVGIEVPPGQRRWLTGAKNIQRIVKTGKLPSPRRRSAIQPADAKAIAAPTRAVAGYNYTTHEGENATTVFRWYWSVMEAQAALKGVGWEEVKIKKRPLIHTLYRKGNKFAAIVSAAVHGGSDKGYHVRPISRRSLGCRRRC